jgi:uncharacterized membrane protein
LQKDTTRIIGTVTAIAALLGLVFAAYSTYDYALHLDRQIHAVHCSFVPGAPVAEDGENACKAALFSPYSAIFRGAYWGGIPISLFAVGSFAFFSGFGVYLALARARAPRYAWLFLGITGFVPVLASLVMFTISATKLGTFCKLCVGIYVASAALAVAAGMALKHFRRSGLTLSAGPAPDGSKRIDLPHGESPRLLAVWLVALGFAAFSPAVVYAASMPDYRERLTSCGTLTVKTESHGALVKIPTLRPSQPVLLFEDPLCPTCKSFHQRLGVEGALEQLDITLALFPLDTECNWMLDRPLHPGACMLSRAVLCAGANARGALEWAFDNQDDLREAGKSGPQALKKKIEARFGPELVACVDDRRTAIKLNQHLHFASQNRIPVSTPQMFLGDKRICEEDTDLGLRYTLSELAPRVLR